MVQIEHFLLYGDTKLPYTIKTDKRLKHLYITISPSLGVVVKNPNFSLQEVQSIVETKARWIAKNLQLLKQSKSIKKIYKDENKILLYGQKEPLERGVKLAELYKQKTQEILPELVKKWSNKTNLHATKISTRKTKRRWGSCNYKNELSFTSSLIQLPQECIEYIILHELSHIKHKHHQKSFWLHVERFMPSYKECERVIKEYSPEI